ncbi:hypothetical protein IWZ03DRAFT_402722 [Phyllosticta citriasiana]|uniref:Uncharacterized protein n=1 Tax=Phyllosticta citriasiana TaxID=595635 RepID=A0ABR1KXC5_9PEZI
MSSRSSSSSTFTSSTSSLSTTTATSSLYPASTPSPPPRYSTHFKHLSPYSATEASKPLPPSPSHHHQQERQPQDQQKPRWTPLSSHGLPRPPVPGQTLHRSRTRRPRASSVSALPNAAPATSEPTVSDVGSMAAAGSSEHESSSNSSNSRPPRSQSRPAARNPYAQQNHAPSCHRQTQSLGQPHHQHNHYHHHHHQHHTAAARTHKQDPNAEEMTSDAATSGTRETSSSSSSSSTGSKLKQLRTKVATSCAGWCERERERRRVACEDVVEVGRGGHWRWLVVMVC